ncbi:MAG TPA: hypothetical protein VE110_04365 [Gemmatimonadaceae bacterium]|jgi:hypothetical protein|nr:hypothetical protein [Gemmatimonadaceae bacterium]
MRVQNLYLLAAAALVGCASTGTPHVGGVPSGNMLSAEEISSAHADNLSAYDAISRLRPNWLAPHGATTMSSNTSDYAIVFVDGQEVGDVTALRNIQAYQVGDMHYYNVTEAGAKFGVRAGVTGAIEVLMKGPNR